MSTCDLSSHKKLYKRSNHHWKETYRQRFRERIKQCRNRLVAQNRGCMFPDEDLSDEDWYKQWMEMNSELYQCHKHVDRLTQVLANENPTSTSQPSPQPDDSNAQLDVLVQIMEELKHEIDLEELALYEESEEMALSSMDYEVVVCPVCKTNFQLKNTTQLICSCALQIDSELDILHIHKLRQQLHEGISRHIQNCTSHVSFSTSKLCGYISIRMMCSACNFAYEIILT